MIFESRRNVNNMLLQAESMIGLAADKGWIIQCQDYRILD